MLNLVKNIPFFRKEAKGLFLSQALFIMEGSCIWEETEATLFVNWVLSFFTNLSIINLKSLPETWSSHLKSSPCDSQQSDTIHCTALGFCSASESNSLTRNRKALRVWPPGTLFFSVLTEAVVGSRALVKIKVQCVHTLVHLNVRGCGFDIITFIYAEKYLSVKRRCYRMLNWN